MNNNRAYSQAALSAAIREFNRKARKVSMRVELDDGKARQLVGHVTKLRRRSGSLVADMKLTPDSWEKIGADSICKDIDEHVLRGVVLAAGCKKGQIPPCGGYHVDTPNGREFDCSYDVDWDCEQCLCNWHTTGGTFNPETGVRHKVKTCKKIYGKSAIDGVR